VLGETGPFWLFVLAGFFFTGLARAMTFVLVLVIPDGQDFLQLYIFSARELAIRGTESMVNMFHSS
jgi:hypothetical protein